MIAIAPDARSQTIGRLNDRCRLGFDRTGRIVITRTCLGTFSDEKPGSRILAQCRLMRAVRKHSFDERDVLRDRGNFLLDDTRVFFVIDCYDANLEYGSEDQADASVTIRVMTIMITSDL